MPGLLRALPGMALSAALLFWVFRELEWDALAQCYIGIDIPLLLVSGSLFIPMQLFRLGRWGISNQSSWRCLISRPTSYPAWWATL